MSGNVTQPARLLLLRRWIDAVLQGLGEAREEIDALNVYPVPDGDTGTNLYLTFEAAGAALEEAEPADEITAWRAMSRGALLGARGNSGVILSQLIRAGAETLAAARDAERGMGADEPVSSHPAILLARALARAADAGYEAVGEPVEGTMLTVARAAGDAAAGAASAGADVAATIQAAAEAAREALARTPDQLAVLRAAGVVDAGGRGLVVILQATETVLTGRRPVTSATAMGEHAIPVPAPPAADIGAPAGGRPSYEVMYLLDADDARVPGLRAALAPLGDSLLVVGGDGLWNVHVHVDDVGAAIEAGIAAGRPHRIRVTHFGDEAAGHGRTQPRQQGRGLVAVAAGPGLARIFREAGAAVVAGGPERRCATGEILEAVRGTGADEVIVLPNDRESVAVADAAAHAAREESIRVAVIPTHAQVQGVAAAAVHEPGRSFDDDVVQMTAAARHARHGAVTVATRDAMTTAGPCRVGDVLGVVEGDFVLLGDDLGAVAIAVVERLLAAGGGEMITLVTGAGHDPSLVQAVARHLRATRPDVDAVVYDGGQERYPLLVAVE